MAFGWLFLVLPALNLLAISLHRGVPLGESMRILQNLPALALLLWVTPFAVGLGLLRVSRWGWWLFLVYAPVLSIYNLVIFSRVPTLFNTAAVGQTLIAFAAMAYFLRRDVFAPYLSSTPRGWRHGRRFPLAVSISVDGETRKTINLSDGGCYVEWPDCKRKLGDALSLKLSAGGEDFSLDGGVARVDAAGVGVAFRNLDSATSARLKAVLAKLVSGSA